MEEGHVRSEHLVRYFFSAPHLDVAYRLASPDWCCYWQQFVASHAYQLQPTPARLTTLTLLIEVSATVIDYKEHRRTLFFLSGIIFLLVMYIETISNNSLVESERT